MWRDGWIDVAWMISIRQMLHWSISINMWVEEVVRPSSKMWPAESDKSWSYILNLHRMVRILLDNIHLNMDTVGHVGGIRDGKQNYLFWVE